MKPEAQRIAIAEACGWTRIMAAPGFTSDNTFPRGVEPGKESMSFFRPLPDYLNDLNAMHEAEKVLTHQQTNSYRSELLQMHRRTDYRDGVSVSGVISSTAAQRAEAFLRTIGKWGDS